MTEIEYIEIDPVTRKILSPAGMLLGVMEDANVERKYFKCPKIVGDNVDLSAHQIYIKYTQSLDKNGEQFEDVVPGIYHCEDVSDEGYYITFSWKLSGNVCVEKGFIAFSVVASDGDEVRWNTYPSVGTVLLTIPGGLEEVAKRYPDIISQLLSRMDEVEALATPEAMQNYVETYLAEHPAELDETLTDNKKAAPAGMVGEMKEEISSLSEEIGSLANSRLKGHTWSVMGDSISQDDLYVLTQYWDYVSNRAGGMTIYNYGKSGDRITGMATRYSEMHYSDIITVFGGVNDWGQSNPTPIGTMEDTTTNTFYGALHILCSGLQKLFPKSLIIFVTPLGNNGFSGFATDENALNLTVYDYAKAIKEVCSNYKIPVVDACCDSLLNPQNENVKKEYFHDGLHLNVLGHEILSYLIESEMLRHYIPTIREDTATEIPATAIELSHDQLTFNDSKSQTITAIVAPENSTDSVIWYSSNESIVKVVNGEVTPISNGTATITAQAGNATATCDIVVNYEVNEVIEPDYAYSGYAVSITGGSFPNVHALCTIPVVMDELVPAETEITAVLKYSNPNKALVAYNTIKLFEANNSNGGIANGGPLVATFTNLTIENNVFTMTGIASADQSLPVLYFAFPFKTSSIEDFPITFTIDDVDIIIGGKTYTDKAGMPCGIFADDIIELTPPNN